MIKDESTEHIQRTTLREYAAWASLVCGVLAALFTAAIYIHIDFFEDQHLRASPISNVWEARYFLVVAPLSLTGVVFGSIGKEFPRTAGLVLSAVVFIRVLAAAIAV